LIYYDCINCDLIISYIARLPESTRIPAASASLHYERKVNEKLLPATSLRSPDTTRVELTTKQNGNYRKYYPRYTSHIYCKYPGTCITLLLYIDITLVFFFFNYVVLFRFDSFALPRTQFPENGINSNPRGKLDKLDKRCIEIQILHVLVRNHRVDIAGGTFFHYARVSNDKHNTRRPPLARVSGARIITRPPANVNKWRWQNYEC